MSELLVRTEPLGGSALSRAAADGTLPSGWYHPRPQDADGWRRHLERVRHGAVQSTWTEELAPAIAARGEAARRLEASAGGRGVVVTTGQQPGLFGGPMYSWSKALSALALADALQEATGIPVAPVFWAATDDADFTEAASTWVAGADGAVRLELEPPAEVGLPLADVPLGAVGEQLEALAHAAGSAADRRPLDAARRAYVPGATVGGAYVALLRDLLEPLGIAVLDASHPAVRRTAGPVLRRALRMAPAVAERLGERTREIEAAGFHPQVALVPGLSLVSLVDETGKSRVPVERGGEVADEPAAVLGTTVLLRPIVERSILPTVAYVAGPGEIAYFAQVGAVADALKEPRPLVVPRWSGTVLEPHVRELLARYELTVDALSDLHAPERELARALLPTELSGVLGAIREQVEQATTALSGAPDPLVPRAVPDGFARDVRHRLERLERRYRAAVARRETERFRDLDRLRGALHPGGVRQERALNLLPLLARYGPALTAAMLASARAHAASLVGVASGPAVASATATVSR